MGVLIFSYIPLICMIISQFIFRKNDLVPFLIFISIIIIAIIMMYAYGKMVLPEIDSEETLYNYLYYFVLVNKYSEYSAPINWFYQKVRNAYLKKQNEHDNKDVIINQLYQLLRSDNNPTVSYAIKHMNGFKKLAGKIIDQYEKINKLEKLNNDQINNFRNEKSEKPFVINWIHDKNILCYLVLFPVHILGCFLLSFEDKAFSCCSFFGNIFLCIPADVILILAYYGVIKETELG